jgi:hypothetical protein
MIIDGALQFTGTAGTAGSPDNPTTGTQASTNVIDLVNFRDMGIGDDPALKILVSVTTTFTNGTNLQVGVSGSVDNSSWTIIMRGPTVIEANLLQGVHLLDVDLPRVAAAYGDRVGSMEALPRYLRLDYITSGTHNAGGVFGAIVLDRQDQISYPPGIVIAN